MGLRARLREFRERHKRAETVLFFAGGFCFDLLLLERIDSVPMLIHQGSYVALLSVLILVDHHYAVAKSEPHGILGKILHWRTEAIHFLFGTLLNAFLVFYFKAAAGWFSLAFMTALGALLIANELARFRELGPIMRVALWSFAVTSYFSYLLPVLFGFLSPWIFAQAVALGCAGLYFLWRLGARFTPDPRWNFWRAVAPGLAIQGLLLALYFAHVVPPVPLAVRFIGIYHGAKREGVHVWVYRTTPEWVFWRHGDTVFEARPGDRIYLFVRVFAPRRFNDGLSIRWAFKDPRAGWLKTDALPVSVTGGQEEGWGAVAYKDHYTPGKWKVEIETADGRTVGTLRFVVVEDDSTGDRDLTGELR